MAAGEINGDRELRHHILLIESLAGKLSNEPVDVHDKVGFLSDGDEEKGRDNGAVGLYPAHESLRAFHLTVYGVILRLIVDSQLIVLQSCPDFFS